jgi:hypothetical protein
VLVIAGIVAIYFAAVSILLSHAPHHWRRAPSRARTRLKSAFVSTIAFQAGICALLFSPLAGFFCFLCSACFLANCVLHTWGPAVTVDSVKQMAGYLALSLYLTIFLISEAVPLPNPGNTVKDLAGILAYARHPYLPTPAAVAYAPRPIQAVSMPRPNSKLAGPLAPGIILKPKVRDAARVIYDPRHGPAFPGKGSFVPFTGEYHVHVTGSRTFPRGAIVEFGSTLDAIYENVYHNPVITEAEQSFRPPVDFGLCSRLRAVIQYPRDGLLIAGFRLIHGNRAVEIGSELVGGDGQDKETVDLNLPGLDSPFPVTSIVVTFTDGSPWNRHKSVKAAVLGWYFVAK